jgi:hypothetical protein
VTPPAVLGGWKLSRPHKAHQVTVDRYARGNPSGRNGGTVYGTVVRCSCAPLAGARFAEAPSQGGQALAAAWYRQHLQDCQPQVALTEPQLRLLHYVVRFDQGARCEHCGRRQRVYHPGVSEGNAGQALVRKGLARNAARCSPPFGAEPEPCNVRPWVDGIEATAAGAAVLEQWNAWGWPR